jgi:hypothetical protein
VRYFVTEYSSISLLITSISTCGFDSTYSYRSRTCYANLAGRVISSSFNLLVPIKKLDNLSIIIIFEG